MYFEKNLKKGEIHFLIDRLKASSYQAYFKEIFGKSQIFCLPTKKKIQNKIIVQRTRTILTIFFFCHIVPYL